MSLPTSGLNNSPQCYGNGWVILAGSVVFGAAGAVSTTTGKGFTVTKAGTGQYTITTNATFKSLLSAQVEFNAAGGAEALQVQRGAFASSNALTVFTVNSSGAATNSSQSGNGFDFVLVMSNSSLDS